MLWYRTVFIYYRYQHLFQHLIILLYNDNTTYSVNSHETGAGALFPDPDVNCILCLHEVQIQRWCSVYAFAFQSVRNLHMSVLARSVGCQSVRNPHMIILARSVGCQSVRNPHMIVLARSVCCQSVRNAHMIVLARSVGCQSVRNAHMIVLARSVGCQSVRNPHMIVLARSVGCQRCSRWNYRFEMKFIIIYTIWKIKN